MKFLQSTRKKSCSLVLSFIIYHSSLYIHPAFAQSPYELKTSRELTLLGASALVYGTSTVLGSTVDPLTPTGVAALNRSEVNAFDRKATYHWSTSADRLSDVTLAGNAALLALVTIGGKPMRQDIKTVAVMFIETLALSSGIERTVKAITQRPRPFVYNELAPLDEKLTRDASQSFFSGHATISFATAVFTGDVFSHYFPHSRLKPYVWIGSLGLATATSALRYEAGLHYPTDLITGALYGSLVGWGIPKLHQVKNQRSFGRRLDVQPWSNGATNGIYLRLALFSR